MGIMANKNSIDSLEARNCCQEDTQDRESDIMEIVNFQANAI